MDSDSDSDNLNSKAIELSYHTRRLPESYKREKKKLFQQIVADAQPAGLQDSSSPEATKENKRKLEVYFNTMKSAVEDQRKKTLDELDDMSPEQQDEAVSFWMGFTSFFKSLMTWIKNKFNEVVQKIKQGFRWAYNRMKNIYGKASDLLHRIFH